jgi:hypothetical protein
MGLSMVSSRESSAAEARLKTIPVAADGFDSPHYSDAVQEVIDSMNFLMGGGSPHAFDFDAMPEDALTVYYADFVLQRLVLDGSENFAADQLPLNPLTIRDIDNAFRRVGAERHRSLFAKLLADADRKRPDFTAFDRAFRDLQREESLQGLNERTLRTSNAFARMSEADANGKIADLLARKLAREVAN